MSVKVLNIEWEGLYSCRFCGASLSTNPWGERHRKRDCVSQLEELIENGDLVRSPKGRLGDIGFTRQLEQSGWVTRASDFEAGVNAYPDEHTHVRGCELPRSHEGECLPIRPGRPLREDMRNRGRKAQGHLNQGIKSAKLKELLQAYSNKTKPYEAALRELLALYPPEAIAICRAWEGEKFGVPGNGDVVWSLGVLERAEKAIQVLQGETIP